MKEEGKKEREGKKEEEEKISKQDSNPEPSALEVSALTTHNTHTHPFSQNKCTLLTSKEGQPV